MTWSGELCDKPVCQNKCSGAAHGTCTAGAEFPFCVCSSQWSGVDCSVPVCSASCSNGAVCIPPVCNCTQGWQGESCSTVLAPTTCPDSCGAGANCSAATGNGDFFFIRSFFRYLTVSKSVAVPMAMRALSARCEYVLATAAPTVTVWMIPRLFANAGLAGAVKTVRCACVSLTAA